MKIALCGSLSFHERLRDLQHRLEANGHTVFVPKSLDLIENGEFVKPVTVAERLAAEEAHDFLREHYRKVEKADAVLIANYDKDGVRGYVGGNTFLEMGYAYYLGKPIYILNPIPDMIYTLEIAAMRPIVLNGNVDAIG